MRCIWVVVNYFERVTIAIVSLLKMTLGSMLLVAVGNFTFGRACVLMQIWLMKVHGFDGLLDSLRTLNLNYYKKI